MKQQNFIGDELLIATPTPEFFLLVDSDGVGFRGPPQVSLLRFSGGSRILEGECDHRQKHISRCIRSSMNLFFVRFC